MKIEHLEKFTKINADEGMYLTHFKEGDDISTFAFAKVIYAPIGTNFDDLNEISIDEIKSLLGSDWLLTYSPDNKE